MNNKIFSTWIRELCSLIFVQSMQALLLVIMLSVVVNLYISSDASYAAKQSMGVYAIIILTLVPKVELLVKRIFGLGSGVMDDSMMGGKNSLLKTGMALKLGGRVLNNAGKVVGGVAKMGASAGSSLFGSVHQKSVIAQNNEKALGSANAASSLPSSSTSNTRSASSTGRSASGYIPSGGQSGQVSMENLTQAIRSANAEDPNEALARAKHENAQRAREGLKQAVSGLAETAGAVGGASLGAVYSLGTGGDDLLSNMAIGAGIGDQIGEMATNATLGNANKIVDWNYDRKQLQRKVNESKQKASSANIDESYKSAVAAAAVVGSTGNKTHSNEKRTVKAPSGVKSAKRAIKAPTSNTPKMPQTTTNGKNTSRQLSSSSKKYYDKAIEAKNKGDMEGYKQNRQVAADMMKAEKNAVAKASTKKYTHDTTTQLKASTMADINRVNRAKNTQKRETTPKSYTSSASNTQKITDMKRKIENNNNTNS